MSHIVKRVVLVLRLERIRGDIPRLVVVLYRPRNLVHHVIPQEPIRCLHGLLRIHGKVVTYPLLDVVPVVYDGLDPDVIRKKLAVIGRHMRIDVFCDTVMAVRSGAFQRVYDVVYPEYGAQLRA